MAASDAHDHPAMLRRLFSSCFHKRSGRLPSKSPHIDGAVETDSSHLTLEPLQSTTHAAQSPQNQIKTSIIGDAEGPIQSGLNSGNQQHLTMPKAAKEKSSRKAARAANDRRSYPRAQRPPRSDPVSCLSLFIRLLFGLPTSSQMLTVRFIQEFQLWLQDRGKAWRSRD